MRFRFVLALAIAALLSTSTASAGDDPAPAPKPTRLDALKKLAGTWTLPADSPMAGATVTYRVTSAGSAVMETLFVGTEKEMITMYTMDGTDLVLTHYCAMQNQPHMRAEPAKDDKTIVFSYVSGGNMKSRDVAHMDSLTMTLTDDTHIRHDWTMWANGKATGKVVLDLTKQP